MAQPPTEKKSKSSVTTDTAFDAALRVIQLARESTDMVPIAKGVCGGVAYILETVKQFKQNREEWRDLASYVKTLPEEFEERVRSFNVSNALEKDLKNLLDAIERVARQVKDMKERPRILRLLQALEDPKTITQLKGTIADAMGRFNTFRLLSVDQKLDVLLERTLSDVSRESNPLRPAFRSCPTPTQIFTGRVDLLRKLADYFQDRSLKRRLYALYGLGGAGKTQIVLKFIEQCQADTKPSRFTDVYFLDGSSAITIEADLKALAKSQGFEESLDAVLNWLASRKDEWLLVFNNADDASLNLRQYFPRGSCGNIIITTRNRSLAVILAPKSNECVSTMSPEDSLNLLLACAGQDRGPLEVAGSIVQELGYFALSIVQAGACISTEDYSFQQYLEFYRQRHRILLEEYKDYVHKYDEYEFTVYTTWEISVSRLSAPSKKLLKIFAFLHHFGLSESVFLMSKLGLDHSPAFSIPIPETEGATFFREFVAAQTSDVNGGWELRKFRKIILEIRSYSLIDFDHTNENYSIHPLVQDWMRSTLSPEAKVASRTAAQLLCGLAIKVKFDDEDYSSRRMLLPHIDAVLRIGDHPNEPESSQAFGETAAGPDVEMRFAMVYREAGQWDKEAALEQRSFATRKSILGMKHRDTLISMGNLAATTSHQGQWQLAEEKLREVVALKKEALGVNDLDTLSTMGNWSGALRDLARWDEAEAIETEVLSRRIEILGWMHPDTLISAGNMATIYGREGKWAKAELMDIDVYAGRRELLGSEHPLTLVALNNLALSKSFQGKWKEAESTLKELMEVRIKKFGADHPATLTVMSNLSSVLWESGRSRDAAELGERILAVRRRTFSEDHPDTLACMANLASNYSDLGRLDEAEELGKEVSSLQSRKLGENHPDTLTSLGNLALVLLKQGKTEEAIALERDLVDRKREAFGDSHYLTLLGMNNLAAALSEIGELEEAESIQRRVLESRRGILGGEHPDTLLSMNTLATTLMKMAQWDEAEALNREVLAGRRKVLGEEHAATLLSINNLAVVLWKRGNQGEAFMIQSESYEKHRTALDEKHPQTVTSLTNLTKMCRILGKVEDADKYDLELRKISQ